MPLIRATAKWIAANLIIPQVGAIHHPRGSAIAVSDDVAHWLVAEQYAELDQPIDQPLSKSVPEPKSENDWMTEAIALLNEATLDDIAEIKGISAPVAKTIYDAKPLTQEFLETLTKPQLAAIQKHLS